MTHRAARTDQEPASTRRAPDRGLRHLVVAGAARIEAHLARGAVADWRPGVSVWSRRSSWRTRQHPQEGADHEQHG